MSTNFNELTNFERLKAKLRFISKKTFNASAAYRNHPRLSEICIEHIYLNYCTSRDAESLMQEAIRCAELMIEDPVCPPLIAYMHEHLEEEENHDEWCARDLEALGMSREQLAARLPSPHITAMIGSQYYLMRNCHPIALLGHFFCLEAHPPTVKFVEGLIQDSGLPAAGFDCLMEHAKVDMEHKQDIINLINNLPLTERHHEILFMSAFQTFRYMALIVEDFCKLPPVSAAPKKVDNKESEMVVNS